MELINNNITKEDINAANDILSLYAGFGGNSMSFKEMKEACYLVAAIHRLRGQMEGASEFCAMAQKKSDIDDVVIRKI